MIVGGDLFGGGTIFSGQLVLGSFDGRIALSNDGQTWSVSQTSLTDPIYSVATNGIILLASDVYGNVSLTTDGASWTTVDTPWVPNAYAETGYVVYNQNLKLFASNTYLDGGMYISSDGVNWTNVGDGIVAPYRVTNSAGDYIFISPTATGQGGDYCQVYSPSTGWTTFANGNYSGGYASVAYNPNNGVYVILGQYSAGDGDLGTLAYCSTDTISWTPIDILYDWAGWGIVGSSLGVYWYVSQHSLRYGGPAGNKQFILAAGGIQLSNDGINWSTPSQQPQITGNDSVGVSVAGYITGRSAWNANPVTTYNFSSDGHSWTTLAGPFGSTKISMVDGL